MKSRKIQGLLLSLLSAAFVVTSCTNYGEDIDDINNRLDALTTSDIASLKSQLASMSTSINGIQDNISNLTKFNTNVSSELSTIKGNISSIQDKIGNLLTKEDFEAYKKTNESTISRLTTLISERVSQAELQSLRELHSKDMTDLLARIQECVTTADLDKAVAEATKTYADDISKLESQIATMLSKSDFETFKSRYATEIEQLNATISQALAAKLDTLTYKEFLAQYGKDQKATQDAIDEAVAQLTASIQDMLTKTAFEEFKSEINATIDKLEAKVDSLSGSVEPEDYASFKEKVEKAIEDVKESVTNLESKEKEDVSEIKTALGDLRNSLTSLSEALYGYETSTTETLASLQASVAKLDQKVDTSVFNAYKAEIAEALENLQTKHGNDIQELQDAMTKKLDASEFAEFKAVYDSSMAAVNKALSTIVSSEEVAQFKAELAEIRTQLKPAVDSLNKVVDTLSTKVAGLESTTAALATAIETSTKTLTEQITALDTRVTELENKYSLLNATVTKLVSRIQSIMYIPDYADRQVLLETSGSTYKRSTLKFEVRPAAIADTIAAAFSTNSAEIKFITREISTRAADATMDILSITADKQGVLTVTARFEPEESTATAFAVALYIKDEAGNDITSDYLTVVRKSASDISDERILDRWVLYRYVHVNTANGEWGDPELVEDAPEGSEFNYIRFNTGGSFVSNLSIGETGSWTLSNSKLTINGSSESKTFSVEELTSDSMTLISADGKTKWLWVKVNKENPYFYAGNFFGYGIEIAGNVWAPVNLGYIPGDYPYGLLFQWGRKDGQGYADAAYQDASVPSIVTGTVSAEEALASSFYRVSESPFDWNSTPSAYLWKTEAGAKTSYDPCPKGWRVPKAMDYGKLVTFSTTKGWDAVANAYSFSDGEATISLPAAGQRAGTTEESPATGRGSMGFYWSSEPTADGAYSLSFNAEEAKVDGTYSERQRGMTIRCVKE